MQAFSITDLYDFLSNKFDKETARNFSNFIEAKMETELENKTQLLATKQDISATREDIAALRLAAKEDISTLNLKIEQTNTQIEKSKNETVRWILGIWLTIILMFVGLYLKN